MKEIELTKGYVALVDDEDYPEISKFSWYAHVPANSDVIYAMRRTKCKITGKSTVFRMHRQILGILDRPEIMVDHIDMNGVNNVRSNLRFVHPTQNQGNTKAKKREGRTSTYKGVCWHKTGKKWAVSIQAWGIKRHLGLFVDEKEAARIYDCFAKELLGDFARLNFPEESP